MKKTAISILMLGILFVPQFGRASISQGQIQTSEQGEIPLIEVIKKLEKSTNTRFFYSVNSLQGLKVSEKNINYQSLKESLDYLSLKHPFQFIIKNNTVSIRITNSKKTSAENTPIKAKIDTIKPDTISPKEKLMEEVVLIGYGTRKKSEITGSTASVKSENMKDVAGANISDMVVGKVAGVQIVNNQASPGSSATIKLRGTSTINAGSDPLIVVDGFPLSEGSNLNSIDPNSIESMDFLKDAASTAIYGSRGANGVIMIKTKEGRKGRVDIKLSSSLSFQERSDKVKLVNAYEFAQYQLEARNNGYVSKDPSNRNSIDNNATRITKGANRRELIPDYLLPYLRGEQGLTDTDWLGKVFRIAPMQNHSVNITGGSENINYAITGTYFNQEGILIGSDYERMSTAVNLTSKLNEKLRIGISFTPSHSRANLIDPSSGWNYNPFDIALISYPFFSPYNSDGSLAISEQYRQNLAPDGPLVENPLAIEKYVKNTENIFRIFGNSFLEYKVLRPLTYKLSVGGDYQNNNVDFFHPSTVGRYRTEAGAPTFAWRNNSYRKNYLVENLLTFNKQFGSHNLEIIAGQSFQHEKFEATRVDAENFPDNSITNIGGGNNFKVTTGEYSWALISYYSRANYVYDGKYLLSASYRRDGSSRFGNNSKWANFPALSLGWVVSKENFFPQNHVVNNLKLRGSWGKSGNNQIHNFGAKALLGITNYNFNGVLAPGYSPSTAPNPNLTWESASSTNIGMDLALFNNSIGINADYYLTYNKNLLLNVPVPYQSGYQTSLQNIGELMNSGFEFALSTLKPVKLGHDFRWTSSLNLTTNKNKVLALAPGQNEIIAGNLGYAITKVGNSISELYGYEVTGIYKSQDQILGSPHMTGTVVGDYIIKDLNEDGIIDSKDKKSWGRTTPNLIGGFTNTFSYKNIDFSFSLYGENGKQIYSRTLASLLEAGEGFSMINKEYYDNRYNPETNPNGHYAMPNLGNFSNDRREARVSNMYFKDASYLRLRTVKLTYNLPKQYASGIGMKAAQFYVLGNNLFTWTKYSGFNVDSDSNNPLAQGYDNANYPVARIYSLGVNFSF